MEIERFKPLYTQSDIHLKKDNEKAIDGEDGKDSPIELSTLVATESGQLDLSTKYKFVGNEIVYNEEWDEMAEVKKIEREKNNIEVSGLEEDKMDI